jgi:hypothetical protein
LHIRMLSSAPLVRPQCPRGSNAWAKSRYASAKLLSPGTPFCPPDEPSARRIAAACTALVSGPQRGGVADETIISASAASIDASSVLFV